MWDSRLRLSAVRSTACSLLLRRIVRLIRLARRFGRRCVRIVLRSRGRCSRSVRTQAGAEAILSVLSVDVLHTRLPEALQLRLVRCGDQASLILRWIVGKHPVFIFFLFVEFSNRRVLACRGDSDDGTPDDLAGADRTASGGRAPGT